MGGQLVKEGGISIALKVCSTLLGFFSTLILARILGAKGYGLYSFAFTLLTFLSIPVQIGLPQLVVREVSAAYVKKNWIIIRSVWKWSRNIIIIFSLLTIIMTSGGMFFFRQQINLETYASISAGLFLVFFLPMTQLSDAALRGIGQVILGQCAVNLVRPLFFIIFVFLLWSIPLYSVSSVTVMVLQVFAAAIGCLFSAVVIRKKCPAQFFTANAVYYNSRKWLYSTIPLALVSGLHLIIGYTDILMLGILRGDYEVGIYRVVVQLSNLIIFGLSSINLFLQPYFSKYYIVGDYIKLQKIVANSSVVILLIAVVPLVIYFVFGDIVIGLLFGVDFVPGVAPLKILSLGQFANAIFGSVGALLNMTGNEKNTMVGMAIAAALNVFLNLCLVPSFGMNGAAVATTVSFVIWNALLWLTVRKKLGVESTAFYFIKLFVGKFIK